MAVLIHLAAFCNTTRCIFISDRPTTPPITGAAVQLADTAPLD